MNRNKSDKPYVQLATAFLKCWIEDRCPICDMNVLSIMLQLVSDDLRKQCIDMFDRWNPDAPFNSSALHQLRF